MAATRAGDDQAFERLYQRYQRRIAAYVHGMVKDHGRAEDITQEVFISALRRMRDTHRPIIFKPWIYEIAKNACIDAFRRSRRAEEISYDADGGLGPADHGRLVSTGPTPDAAVDTRMSLDHLRGAFGGLSETHHDILVMRELEGLSYREIGQRLGMSRPSVESTLFRARRRLTEEYEELASGERCLRIQALIADSDGGRMGVRDERRMARHVSHCQPCRRAAYAAGLDVAALAARKSLGGKVAALLPFPAFVKRRWFGGGGGGHDGGTVSGGTLSHWSSTLGQYAEPLGGGFAKTAALVATVAAAGVGAGVATTSGDSSATGPRPAAVSPAAPSGAPATGGAAAKQAHTGATAVPGARTSTSGGRHGTSRAGSRPRSARHGGGGGAGGGGSAGGGGVSPGAAGSASGGHGGATPSSLPAGVSADGATSKVGGALNTLVPNADAPGAKPTAPGVQAPKVQVPGVHVPASGSRPVDAVTSTATNAATHATQTVTNAATHATQTVTNAATHATQTVTNAATHATQTVTNAVKPVTGAVTGGATSRPVSTATGTASPAVTTVSGAASKPVSTVTGAVSNPVSTATGAASTPVRTVTGAASNPVATVTGAASTPVRTVTGAASNPVATVTGAASNPVGTATSAAGAATGPGGILPGG